MPQVLKTGVRERIHEAARDEFYDKGYKGATMRDIAAKAGVPVGLTYSYYKNKDDLFLAVVRPVMDYIESRLQETRKLEHDREAKKKEELATLGNIFNWPKELVILIDKSEGVKYQRTGEKLVSVLRAHIDRDMRAMDDYDELYAEIIINCLISSVLTVARNFKDRAWAEGMMKFVSSLLFYRAA